MTLRRAIFVRPFTCTYLTSPSYSFGRNFVKASVVSYMWLSASKTGKSTTFDMAYLREDDLVRVFNFDVNIMPKVRAVAQMSAWQPQERQTVAVADLRILGPDGGDRIR